MNPPQTSQRPAIDAETIERALRRIAERSDASPARDRALAYANGRYARGIGRQLDAIATIGFERSERVLDVGCGVGQWSIALAVRNEQVTGIDIRPEYVELATALGGELGLGDAATFSVGEAERLEHDAGSVDAVLSHMVMMWVPEPELGIAELSRVLKPAGRAYIAYTTEAMLIRGIAGAEGVGWERARVSAVNLVSSALYCLGLPQFMGSRVRAYRHGQLEQLAAIFGLEVLGSPEAEDGPREWRGHRTTHDFVAAKAAEVDAAADRYVREQSEADPLGAARRLISLGAPRLALAILDRAEPADADAALAVRLAAHLKTGDLDSAGGLLDRVSPERGAGLRALYALQRQECAAALRELDRCPPSADRDFLIGCAHLAGGEPDAALAVFERELAGSPGRPRAVGGAVLASLDQGDPERVGTIVAAIPEADASSRTAGAARWTAVSGSRTEGVEELSDTSQPLRLDAVGLDDPDRMPYQVTNRTLLPLVFDNLELGDQDVFVDFGCGKGRVLLAAASRPLRRVIGLDVSEALCAVARANVEHNREHLRCKQVEVLTADATEFAVPDDMTVAYMYNPFKGDVFRRVMNNIVASLDRNPRKLTLVYLLPAMDALVQESGRFSVVKRERFGEGSLQEVVYYESQPEPDPAPAEERPATAEDGEATYTVEVRDAEFAAADRRTRAQFLSGVRRLEAGGFFARDERPAKEWAAIDLDEYPTFEAFVKACRKVHSGNAVRDARKAAERGYYSKFFDPGTFVADMVEIDASTPERQGRPMASHYARSVEERGGFPDSYRDETPPQESLAWDRHFGVFGPEPGHRQGDVVTDEQLLSYIKFRRAGAFSFYGTILGHAEHLREGIMYKMHLDLVELILRNRVLLADGDPSADRSIEGVRFVGYARFFNTGEGLSMWKKRMLFRPAYFRMRYPDGY